ncbi:MAG: hypothetical protein ACN2B6_01220 [Rickettsiales bacterium]
MSKVLDGRFTDEQVNSGLIKDVVENPNIESVMCICKFIDGSMDVYGNMSVSDLSYGLRIIESSYIDYTIESMADIKD